MKKYYVLFVVFSFSVILSSCASRKFTKTENTSLIAVTAHSDGLGMSGYGMLFTLQNMETGALYKSKAVTRFFSPHSIINNLPAGIYTIQELEIPLGSMTYKTWSPAVKKYFGEIVIEPNKRYYIGDFTGKKEFGRYHSFYIYRAYNGVPLSLIEKIDKAEPRWSNVEFILLYPNTRDSLMIN